jgi:hypothetical protein
MYNKSRAIKIQMAKKMRILFRIIQAKIKEKQKESIKILKARRMRQSNINKMNQSAKLKYLQQSKRY